MGQQFVALNCGLLLAFPAAARAVAWRTTFSLSAPRSKSERRAFDRSTGGTVRAAVRLRGAGSPGKAQSNSVASSLLDEEPPETSCDECRGRLNAGSNRGPSEERYSSAGAVLSAAVAVTVCPGAGRYSHASESWLFPIREPRPGFPSSPRERIVPLRRRWVFRARNSRRAGHDFTGVCGATRRSKRVASALLLEYRAH